MENTLLPPQRSNWYRTCVLLFALTMLALLIPSAPTLKADAESRMLPQLKNEAGAGPDQEFRVIVLRNNRSPQADARAQALGGRKGPEVSGDAFVTHIRGRALAALASDPAVRYVTIDARMLPTGTVDASKLSEVYPSAVKAKNAWGFGYTGLGVGIAFLDTGVNASKRDFSARKGTRVTAQVRFNANTTNNADAHGHGTHVAGIATGNSWYYPVSEIQGKYIGVAPEANIINVKVSDDAGISYLSDVVNAIEWVITNRQAYNIRVMNLSLISSVAESYKTSILAAAVERAWFSGIFVVVSAGNGGANSMYYPPANDPFVVTVGASDTLGTKSGDDDTVVSWSSYGLTQDGYSKPDAVAPGRNIVAPLTSDSSTLARAYPERIVDGSYIRMSGTSMSAPMVSGLAAIAFQKYPGWTNDQLKWLLHSNSAVLGSKVDGVLRPYPGQGGGQIDIDKVISYPGTPQYANQGVPISAQLIGPNGETTYVNGSTSNWSTSNWSTSNWSTSNWSTSNWSTANWSTANWSAMSTQDVN